MSSRYQLTAQEIADLESAHRQTSDKRYADRLKTVYLLGKGWSVTQVAEALMIDRETVRNHYKRYRKGVLPALQKFEAGGSESFLNELQKQALDQHLHKNLYLTAKEIAHYVEQTWGVSYSESGITQLLYRMGYVYKKPKTTCLCAML
jgi:transposase